jgi:hypothetical protein
MSARGARSRKVAAKELEKKEKKATGKQSVQSIKRPHDAFSDWRPTPGLSGRDAGVPSRSITISSDISRTTSRSSSTHASGNRPRLNTIDSTDSAEIFRSSHRPHTSTSGNTSLSDNSREKEKLKYQANGKGTKAPRGRGGGVPVKKPTVQSPPPPLFRVESTVPSSNPNHKTWINFRIWDGGESGLRPYGGFDYVSTCKNSKKSVG